MSKAKMALKYLGAKMGAMHVSDHAWVSICLETQAVWPCACMDILSKAKRVGTFQPWFSKLPCSEKYLSKCVKLSKSLSASLNLLHFI